MVIVDEASMASTLDLDLLIAAAARAAAKVVLVGDPAQIGVVNGPGRDARRPRPRRARRRAATEIHRFSQPWERRASLALRHGEPDALDRLPAPPGGCTPAPTATPPWTPSSRTGPQRARAGQDALMLARTRADVDALNPRARAAALAAGEVTGPVTVAGERDWQAGDLLRTRRNDRRLAVGDGHVRNGDRYRVLGPGPQDGLIVEDLAGRGRTVLPAAYLAEHAEYGWATTIDAAQGATADVGIVLVRPGLDREHLYVAMTRGRHANHAYITPDPATDDDTTATTTSGRPAAEGAAADTGAGSAGAGPVASARGVLQAALTVRRAGRRAHRPAAARTQAAQTAAAAPAPGRTGGRRDRAPAPAGPPAAGRARPAARTARAAARPSGTSCASSRDALHRTLQQTADGAGGVAAVGPQPPPRARPTRSAAASSSCGRPSPTQDTLDAGIDRLTRQVAQHTREHLASDLAGQQRARPDGLGPGACRRAGPAPAGRRQAPDLPASAAGSARAVPRAGHDRAVGSAGDPRRGP